MKTKYVECEECEVIQRINEEDTECAYCYEPLQETNKKVTEREYREYWKGVKGQPKSYNDIIPSTQTTFILEVEK